MAGKWNYETHEYDACDLPSGAALYSNDMDKIVNCARCGRMVVFGETYTSFEIHNEVGFGYAVCPTCHALEVNRALAAKAKEEDQNNEQHGDSLMRKGIEALDLCPRSYRCLKRAGINTIEELCDRSYERMKYLRGIGKKTLGEIVAKMCDLGVWFKGE